jgi:esterase/lipase
MLDEAVPWEHSLKIADAVASDDVELSFVKDGEHRLSRDSDLDRLLFAVQNVIERV